MLILLGQLIKKMTTDNNSNLRGIAWFSLHCLLFSLLSIVTKLLLKKFDVFEIIFLQTVGVLPILLIWVLVKFRNQVTFNIFKVSKWHFIRAFLWAMATAMYFYAVTQINLSKAVAISFTVPIFTSIFAVFFLKEKLTSPRVLTLIFGVIGMLIIVNPGVHYESAVSWVIAASILWSITDILIKMVGKENHAVPIAFYFSFYSALFCLPLALDDWTMPESDDILWLLILNLLFMVNMISVVKSYQNAQLTAIMPFTFSQLVFTALIDYLVFAATPEFNTVIGAIVIVISSSCLAYSERKSLTSK